MRLSVACLMFLNCAALLGCAATKSELSYSTERSLSDQLVFIDIGRFDNDLRSDLQSPKPVVRILFYEKVSPNNTPERLEKWLNAVERTGGKVEIEPPPGELVPRSPFALISLLGGLWNAIKMATELRNDSIFQAARDHDAVISLDRNTQGQVIISKVTFRRR